MYPVITCVKFENPKKVPIETRNTDNENEKKFKRFFWSWSWHYDIYLGILLIVKKKYTDDRYYSIISFKTSWSQKQRPGGQIQRNKDQNKLNLEEQKKDTINTTKFFLEKKKIIMKSFISSREINS